MDGVLRRRGGVLERLLHYEEDRPVVVRVAQTAPDTVLFGARARTRAAARYGIERMRFALGVDDALGAFHRRFADDPLIGRSVRMRPWLRVGRRPEPLEALALAVCEQLIEYERAVEIQRRVVVRLGRRRAGWDGDEPTRAVRATCAIPDAGDARRDRAGAARVLRPRRRSRAGADACRQGGGARTDRPEGRRSRARLAASARIPGIGAWTVEMMALRGQGRHDQLPAGDVGLLKLVGRRLSGGDPRARAEEHEVRAFFAGYGEWAGLAAVHMQGL